MRDAPGGDSELDAARARIRLLEFQIEHLRREMNFARRRHEDIIYSVAWALAAPLRAVEMPLRRLLARDKTPAPLASHMPPLQPLPPLAPVGAQAVPRRPRLLIDVTRIAARDDRTGVQRVVRRTLEALYRETDLALQPLAVRLEGGGLISCDSFAAAQTGAPQSLPDAPLAPASGDVLLMLDNAWSEATQSEQVFASVRAAGGQVVSFLYDLIPLTQKAAAYADVPEQFEAWLVRALRDSDAVIAISAAVAEELVATIAARGYATRPGLRIGWAHIGADFAPRATGAHRAALEPAFASGAPSFLVVGTLEPRKGHRVALEAFDLLWAANFESRLVFVGRRGWHVDALIEDIRAHPQFGRRLFWFDDASDADLHYAYDHCAAVLAPSYAEGYGLPLSEAAAAGRPVICSDIPVFREIGRDGALYFTVNDSRSLAQAVQAFAQGTARADSARILQPTWRDAARRIVALIEDGGWAARLP